MSGSSRSTSPDPLALPSSPLATRSSRYSSVKPLAPRSSNVAFSSPSKSFVMDTGKAGDASPWRIKVTVEAEPREGSGSPSKRVTRTTKVPLKGEDFSSPVKKSNRRTVSVEAESGLEVKRPQRKRKGTPIRRQTRTQPAQVEPTTDEDDAAALMPPPSSATRSARRKSLQQMPTQRSKRLSQAREELDQALQDAVGDEGSDGEEEEEVECDAPGDLTVMNEDFTMVSVETLQSMRADTSLISHHNEGDKSGLSVSYLPSSPPRKVDYPNLSDEVKQAKSTPAQAYDVMSWKPTGPAKTLPSPQQTQEQQRLDSEPSEWQRHREAVSRQIDKANTSQVIVINDNTEAESVQADEDEEADIWQEEASRSLDEDQQVHQQQQEQQPPLKLTTASPKLDDLFADQPLKPRRAKIPRTWRRSSGVDFSYVDSPAHVEPLQVRKRSGGSTDGNGSRASSGVLTPPSSEDEARKPQAPGAGEGEEESSDVSLTQPDGVGTQLQDPEEASQAEVEASEHAAPEDVASPFSDSSSSVTSPDGEDTGMFWQSNMPQIYRRAPRPRPTRQRAMDISELLGLGKSSSPAKKITSSPKPSGSSPRSAKVQYVPEHKRYSPLHMRPVEGRFKSSPSDAGKSQAVSSPLRRSLLRSSKVQGSPIGKAASRGVHMRYPQPSEQSGQAGVDGTMEAGGEESFASKASDQRQLLGEMAAQHSSSRRTAALVREEDVEDTRTLSEEWAQEVDGTREASEHFAQDVDDTHEMSEQLSREEEQQDFEEEYDSQGEEEYEDETEQGYVDQDPSRSYEERLNLESPQKIQVRFNDSIGNSSMLEPKRQYAPLFTPTHQHPAAQRSHHASPPTVTLVSKKSTTTNVSSAQEQASAGIFSRLSTTFWSAVVRPTGPPEILHTLEPVYSPALRTHIRSRYGVLASSHPWTMAHMRTLHRMHNSCTSGKSDSIIPKSGLLPFYLTKMLGRQLTSVSGAKTYVFSTQHAHVVDAFMQILVPSHVIEAMEKGEVEMLGDGIAREYRSVFGGRQGREVAYRLVKVPGKGGLGVEWVGRCLGDVLWAEEDKVVREQVGDDGED